LMKVAVPRYNSMRTALRSRTLPHNTQRRPPQIKSRVARQAFNELVQLEAKFFEGWGTKQEESCLSFPS
jgi:hypothetical protein